MLTREEAKAIRQGIDDGTRGPVLLKWTRLLLEDYEARATRRIRCDLCNAFQPLIEDSTGDGVTDLLCGKCRHVCAIVADH